MADRNKGLTMVRTLVMTILVAFTIGLVAETALVVCGFVGGNTPDVHTAIELCVCWGVVLATFVGSVAKTAFRPWW